MLSLDDILNILKVGGPSVILCLMVALYLLLSRKLRFPDEINTEKERRIADIEYRDKIIEKREAHIDRQADQIDRLQDNFELALKSIKEEILPLLEKTLADLQSRAGSK